MDDDDVIVSGSDQDGKNCDGKNCDPLIPAPDDETLGIEGVGYNV